MTHVVVFAVGVLFALGLGISGMTQPQKVVGFLDILGSWDPSLMFVMIGAIGVHMISYRLIRKRSSPVLTADWHVPVEKRIDSKLLLGAALFGIGWGIAGYCPGPAITSLANFEAQPLIFVGSMIFGMLLLRLKK